jgi:thioredoxin reductase (NADPH)
MREKQIVVIGQGPAGLSAALYTSRAGADTLVVGLRPKIDGEYEIENYFGFPEPISAAELMARGRAGALRFGAELKTERVLGVHMEEDGLFTVRTESEEVRACAVILATGISRVRPGIENLDAYDGKGVSYCVSCDGFFYRGKQVVVLGEGVYAASQALELTNYTPKVAVCANGRQVAITPEYLARLEEKGIPVLPQKIERLEGAGGLERVVFADGTSFDTWGLFVAMGEASSSDFAAALGLERSGAYLVADARQQTNIPGIFAAGDCVGRFLQIAVAVGEGAIAGRFAGSYAKKKCPRENGPTPGKATESTEG